MDQTVYYYEIALSKLGLDVIPDGYQKQLPKHVQTPISPVDRHEDKACGLAHRWLCTSIDAVTRRVPGSAIPIFTNMTQSARDKQPRPAQRVLVLHPA
jgi:hypothetical protein